MGKNAEKQSENFDALTMLENRNLMKNIRKFNLGR